MLAQFLVVYLLWSVDTAKPCLLTVMGVLLKIGLVLGCIVVTVTSLKYKNVLFSSAILLLSLITWTGIWSVGWGGVLICSCFFVMNNMLVVSLLSKRTLLAFSNLCFRMAIVSLLKVCLELVIIFVISMVVLGGRISNGSVVSFGLVIFLPTSGLLIFSIFGALRLCSDIGSLLVVEL